MNPKSCWFSVALAGLMLVSCKTVVAPPSGERPATLPSGEAAAPPRPHESAALKRQQAAAALTDRGRVLMADGQIDPAMRLFEQALSLAPQYGPGFYFLAEAWLAKNNWSQAREFHHQAARYLRTDGDWEARVAQQRRRVDRAAGAGMP
jgi:tetratricopeptide (TPR) repeat protein